MGQHEYFEEVSRRFWKLVGARPCRDHDLWRSRVSVAAPTELVNGVHDLLACVGASNLVQAVENNHARGPLEDVLHVLAATGMPPLACVISSARKHSTWTVTPTAFLGFFGVSESLSHTSMPTIERA